jgi:hypothetical protein
MSATRRLALCVVGLVLLALASSALLNRTYALRRYYAGGQALWRQADLYVYVGVNTVGHRRSWIRDLLPPYDDWFPLASERIRQDGVLFYVTAEGHTKHELRDFPSGVTIVPVEGTIYALIGCERAPCPVWKWTGDRFTPLGKAEAESVDKAVGLRLAEAIGKSGWRSYKVEMVFSSASTSLPLQGFAGKETELVLRTTDQAPTLKSLSIRDAGMPPRPLLDIDEGWRFVEASTYAAERGHWGLR